MSPISYLDVFGISFERDFEQDICPGAIVRTGENQFPRFAVVAIDAERAWVRNVQTGADQFARTSCLRLVQCTPE